jgi:hypothetical protein
VAYETFIVGYEEQREEDTIDKILNNYFNRLD